MNRTYLFKRFLLVIGLLLVLMAGFWVRKSNVLSSVTKPIAVQMLPDLQFADQNGQLIRASDWQGKFRVVNFWASWCPPCLEELPVFQNLHTEFAEQGVQFLGVALDDTQSVRQVVERLNIHFPQLIAGDQGVGLSQNLGNTAGALPFTVLVNQQGLIVAIHAGAYKEAELRSEIESLIN